MSAVLRFFLAIVMMLAVAAPLFAAEGVVVDKIVAKVNGDVITLLDLNDKVRIYVTQVLKRNFNPADPGMRELQQQVLSTMIDDILLRQEARRYKITVPDSEVEARIRDLKQKNGNMSEAQFVQQLKLEGMTRQRFAEDMRRNILKEQLLGYMVQRKVVVGEDEIKAYYEAHKGDIRAEPQGGGQRLGLIVVSKLEDAKALKARIAGGQISFADAARKFSSGPGAAQGGDLGRVNTQDIDPRLGKILESLRPGEVSDPILLDGKPAILTILGEPSKAVPSPAGEASFESVRGAIQEKLYRERLDKQFAEYMEKLRTKSVITINL